MYIHRAYRDPEKSFCESLEKCDFVLYDCGQRERLFFSPEVFTADELLNLK